jgi:hypothetical protein
MTHRVFLLECSASHWIDVAKSLSRRDIEIVYWSAWHRMADNVRLSFPSCIFHDTIHAKRALGPSGEDCYAGAFDEACEKVWREEAQVVYDMMNRFDHSRDMTFVERSTLFFTYLVYWRAVIRKHSPDLVIFPAPPHVVYDYIVLALCRALGVKTLMFEEVPVCPPYSIFMDDYRNGLPDFQLQNAQDQSEIAPELLQLLSRLRADYKNATPAREVVARADMAAALEAGKEGLKARVKVVSDIDKAHKGKYGANEKIVNVSSLYKETSKSLRNSFEGDYANMRYMEQLVKDREVTQTLHDFYHEHATDVSSLAGRSFVYFPLAGQPERTSNPQADIYTNQIIVANLISHAMPSGWEVVAKEHPNQFHPNFAVNMCRSVEYYAAMLKVPQLALVPSMHDPFDLIDQAAFVATTGGTAAIEAVARGKPVLLFGDAWYRDCPGIYRVRNLKDVVSVFRRFTAGELHFSPDDLIRYLESIRSSAFKGIADYPPQDFVVDDRENMDNLVEIVIGKLS